MTRVRSLLIWGHYYNPAIVKDILWVKCDLLEGREKGDSIHWTLLWTSCMNSIHSMFIPIVQLLKQT